MSIEYGSPELQIALSNRLLTKFFASQAAALLPCPKDPDSGNELLTDLVIDEIVTVRSDDATAMDVDNVPAGGSATSALAVLGKAFNIPAPDPAYVAFRDGAIGETLQPPAVFVIVSGSVRQFLPQDLRAKGTSDSVARTLFQRSNLFSPALLFSVRLVRTTQPTVIQAIRFQLEAIWNSGLANKPATQGLISGLKNRLPPQDIGFDILGPLLGAVGLPTEILNIGVTTDFWLGGTTPSARGLRIGIDVHGPLRSDGWKAFYSGKPWLADAIKLDTADLGVLVDGALFGANLEASLAQKPLPSIPNAVLEKPTVSLGGGTINVNITARDGDVPLGDAVATLTPIVAQRNISQTTYVTSYLDIQACARFEENPGGAILIGFLTTLVGGLIGAGAGGPVGAVLGAVAGTFVGINLDLALSSFGNQAIQQHLASASAVDLGLGGGVCGTIDTSGCRTCSLNAQLTLAGIGDLLLSGSAWEQVGVGLSWTIREPTPASPGKLAVNADSWRYDFGICQNTSRDPSCSVIVRNDGGLPLRICWVSQDTSQPTDVGVLDVKPPVLGSEAAPPILLGPGQAFRLTARAAITGNAAYDQMKPPSLLLRVLSSGGAVEIDLNAPQQAFSQDAQTNQRQSAWGQLLCDFLKIHELPDIWREIPFRDPIPFSRLDNVIERVDARLTGPQTVERLMGLDLGNRLLVTGSARSGGAHLIAIDRRAPAETHRFPHVAVVRENAEARRGENVTLSISRTLYVGRYAIALYSRILDAVAMSDRLVVATDDRLRIGRVAPGSIVAWTSVAVPGLRMITRWERFLAVATDKEILLFTPDLHLNLRRSGAVVALTSNPQYLFVSDGLRLKAFLITPSGARVDFALTMPGVTRLISVGGKIFGLAQRAVWRLDGQRLVDTGIRADELLRFDRNYGAAVCGGGTAAIFNEDGEVVMETPGRPWLTFVLEWPDLAVEVRPSLGMLLLFNRFETVVDATEAQRRLTELRRELQIARPDYV